MHAALQVIEATHGFAQSLQRVQSPEFGAAESVAWAVPAKGCASPNVTPPPNPIASRATSVSFMIRPTTIIRNPKG